MSLGMLKGILKDPIEVVDRKKDRLLILESWIHVLVESKTNNWSMMPEWTL